MLAREGRNIKLYRRHGREPVDHFDFIAYHGELDKVFVDLQFLTRIEYTRHNINRTKKVVIHIVSVA